MNQAEFWNLIESAALHSGGSIEKQTERLKVQLSTLSKEDLLNFIIIFWKNMHLLYTWDILAVLHIAYIERELDLLSFTEFRAWLISRGCKAFNEAVTQNRRAAELVIAYLPKQAVGESCDAFCMLAYEVYEERFSEDPVLAMGGDYLEDKSAERQAILQPVNHKKQYENQQTL